MSEILDGTTPSVLIAEDDEIMIKLLQAIFRHLGCRVHVASDGASAVSAARRLQPALVVLDLNLPQRHGLEILRELRSDAATRSLKVLVLTALAQPEIEDQVRAAGADDFLIKPVDLDTMFARLGALLPGRGAA